MRLRILMITGLAVLMTACGAPADNQTSVTRGRFVGIGVYSAGQLWSRMAINPPANAATATTADDEHIIVVVDSQTGEVRECGDYSGVCASFNPWTRAVAGQQVAPVKLTKHAADLALETHAAASQGH